MSDVRYWHLADFRGDRMLIRWISVSISPMASGAKPAGERVSGTDESCPLALCRG